MDEPFPMEVEDVRTRLLRTIQPLLIIATCTRMRTPCEVGLAPLHGLGSRLFLSWRSQRTVPGLVSSKVPLQIFLQNSRESPSNMLQMPHFLLCMYRWVLAGTRMYTLEYNMGYETKPQMRCLLLQMHLARDRLTGPF